MPAPIPYLSNKLLVAEIVACQAAGVVSNELGRMLLLMTSRYFMKSNYRGYSFVDEIRGEALAQCVVASMKFDPAKSSNAFSYLTTCMTNAANRVLNREKRARVMRDEMISEAGAMPSSAALAENDAVFYDMDHPPLPALPKKKFLKR